MIELMEGVPGSGKSYYGIKERFLPWVRAGRKIYVYVDGIYLDKLAHFTGIPLDEPSRQVMIWKDATQVLTEFQKVEPGSFVIIDEAQTVFRAMEKVDRSLLRWLETHRHYGVDVLMMCQEYRQMSQSVTRLVESTTKFRKLAFLGFSDRYQGKVRGNPEETEIIRMFTGKYESSVYAYYSSYSAATIKELRKANNVFMSPRIVLGIAGLAAAGFLFSWHPWVTATPAPSQVQTKSYMGGLDKNDSKSLMSGVAQSIGSTIGPVLPGRQVKVRILGAVGDASKWVYLLDTGELLTASQIAGRFGIDVREVNEGGISRLVGEGVAYGPSRD